MRRGIWIEQNERASVLACIVHEAVVAATFAEWRDILPAVARWA